MLDKHTIDSVAMTQLSVMATPKDVGVAFVLF